MESVTQQHNCRVCGEDALIEIPEYATLPRVTSDCKIFPSGGRLMVCGGCGAAQNPADEKWLGEIAEIYSAYAPYHQSGGIEQAVFDAEKGKPRLRSDVMIERLHGVAPLGPEGTAIDIGCGNGVFLKALSRARPGWALYGHELNDLHKAELEAIPGFAGFHMGALSNLPANFDLVTMIHALEHFPDPAEGLAELRDKLHPEGHLFIEVPNGAATPFDLMIADHASHFTSQDLARLFQRVGLGTVTIAEDWVTKELSAVARRDGATAAPAAATPDAALAQVRGQLCWLQQLIDEARAIAAASDSFGIFGSSVAAIWLLGVMGDDVDFFVDEDPSRQGATLHGRPIHAPTDVPEGSAVYMTLIPAVAQAVAGRLARSGVTYRGLFEAAA